MNQSPSIAALAKALVATQTEFKAITKDSVNPHFKNSYASLDVITETVRPILAKHGLAVVSGTVQPHTDELGHLKNLNIETTGATTRSFAHSGEFREGPRADSSPLPPAGSSL